MARRRRRRRGHHDFSDEVDDSRGWLFGFKFSKNVALVISFAGLFTSNKSKAATICDNRGYFTITGDLISNYLKLLWTDGQSRFLATLVPASILRIQSTIGNGQHGIMSPNRIIKKELNSFELKRIIMIKTFFTWKRVSSRCRWEWCPATRL